MRLPASPATEVISTMYRPGTVFAGVLVVPAIPAREATAAAAGERRMESAMKVEESIMAADVGMTG